MKLKRWSPLLYTGVGLAAGFVLAISIGASERTGGRYDLKVWSTPPEGGFAPGHGAYRIDSENGDVWEIPANGAGGTAKSKVE